MYEIFEQLLQKFGVTAYQVSKATGIGQSTLSSWKMRNNILGSDKLQKIADYFGVSIDYLLGNSYAENIGPAIKNARERQGITLEELAAGVGISAHGLDRYEKLNEPVREDIMNKIEDFLGESIVNLKFNYLMSTPSVEKQTKDESYYLNDDAKEMAQFLYDNPEYKVLFDASRKVKKEDINFVKEMMDRMRGSDPDDFGC